VRWGWSLSSLSADPSAACVRLSFRSSSPNLLHQPRSDDEPASLNIAAALVVGADGIFSRVRQLAFDPPTPALHLTSPGRRSLVYLGVVVVLGICANAHPLLYERVLQTVDGNTRVFVMPYAKGWHTSLVLPALLNNVIFLLYFIDLIHLNLFSVIFILF
jgi:hypothetical protein